MAELTGVTRVWELAVQARSELPKVTQSDAGLGSGWPEQLQAWDESNAASSAVLVPYQVPHADDPWPFTRALGGGETEAQRVPPQHLSSTFTPSSEKQSKGHPVLKLQAA